MPPRADNMPSPTILAVATWRLPSTRRGARCARRFAVRQLADWGLAPDSGLSRDVALIVAELAANAITHGHVPGRDFEVRLTRTAARLHIEVTDTRSDAAPAVPPPRPDGGTEETGRGLLIVEALAGRWGVEARTPNPGKTVWVECDLHTVNTSGPSAPARASAVSPRQRGDSATPPAGAAPHR